MVRVSYAEGDTRIDTVRVGARFFLDQDHQIGDIPAECLGLQFTQRRLNTATATTIDAPAGATVYLLLGSAGPAAQARQAAAKYGWSSRIGEMHLQKHGKGDASLSLFRQTFNQSQHIVIPGGGFAGVVVISEQLSLAPAAPVMENKPAMGDSPQPRPSIQPRVQPEDNAVIPGPNLPIKKRQTEIQGLAVAQDESGQMFGITTELILTATPGNPPGYTPVRFVSPVGDDMLAALDDVLRTVRVNYPKWAASRVELSFENRYTPKDGGSIAAAIGTLLMSMLQGFDVDDKAAMTGDLTADGKLRQIGGVAAKIRGATASGCNLVILPAENYDQVVDAMVYEGPSLLMNIQVIGAADLQEATALARVDRDEKLAQALDTFGSIAPLLKASPARIHTKAMQDKLKRVLELAPNHYSARLLLLVAQNKQPTRLSATASMYYIAVATQQALPAIFDGKAGAEPTLPKVVDSGLVNLRKLRSRVDAKVLPCLDAMVDFIQTINAINAGRRDAEDLEPKRQKLLDALSRLQTDRALMEKMLHEGI